MLKGSCVLGPGRRETSMHSSNPSKPRRAAPSGPSQGGQNRQRTYSSSLKRYSSAANQSQPHLPKSGAQHKAKRSSKFDPNSAEFMRTPESGACGYVVVVVSCCHCLCRCFLLSLLSLLLLFLSLLLLLLLFLSLLLSLLFFLVLVSIAVRCGGFVVVVAVVVVVVLVDSFTVNILTKSCIYFFLFSWITNFFVCVFIKISLNS